jgi:radical SAM protein with 4Fe4S-binding SPASM domain
LTGPNRISYDFLQMDERALTKEPFYIQWHITNACNLRCRHCYQDDFSNTHDLDWTGLKEITDHILEAIQSWNRTACIHLTGGEPLLKPELYPLLEYLHQQPAIDEVGLITNGLCIDPEIIERLSPFSKLTKIKISLDGADAETNDAIRGKGVFRKVLKNLSLVTSAQRFEIILMFTLMKSNYRNLSSVLTLFQEWNVDGLILERFIPWGRGRARLGEVLEKEQWADVIRTLSDFFSTDTGEKDFLPFQAFNIRQHRGEVELLGAPCVVGADGLCVMPDGTVFPCRRFPVSMGNLRYHSLKEIWETSDLLKSLERKETLKGKCGYCDIESCRGCRSLSFSLTGDYLAEDPHCGYQPKPPL